MSKSRDTYKKITTSPVIHRARLLYNKNDWNNINPAASDDDKKAYYQKAEQYAKEYGLSQKVLSLALTNAKLFGWHVCLKRAQIELGVKTSSYINSLPKRSPQRVEARLDNKKIRADYFTKVGNIDEIATQLAINKAKSDVSRTIINTTRALRGKPIEPKIYDIKNEKGEVKQVKSYPKIGGLKYINNVYRNLNNTTMCQKQGFLQVAKYLDSSKNTPNMLAEKLYVARLADCGPHRKDSSYTHYPKKSLGGPWKPNSKYDFYTYAMGQTEDVKM